MLASGGANAAEPLVFPVRFVVLTGRPEVVRRATLAQMHEEVRIMNRYFVTEDRRAIVRFTFHSFHPYESIRDSPCEVVALANRPVHTRDFIFKTSECADPRVYFPGALNVFIIDTFDRRKGYAEEDSYAGGQGNRRFVALDYERLGHIFGAEEHELGHAFGLNHVCHPGADGRTKTNIMTQREACPGGVGREGDRSIGFNREQERQILEKARAVHAYIAGYRPIPGIRNPGFEDLANFEWSRRGYTINHRSGKHALWADAGVEISQQVFVERAGEYSLKFYFNCHGPGAFAAIDINGKEVGRLRLEPGGGYGKPFAEARLPFRLDRASIVRVRFFGGAKKLWVDDVSLQ